MHKEILSRSQLDLLDLLKDFSSDFHLVGGTAIALHLGHRRSIDFDLFSSSHFDHQVVLAKLKNKRDPKILVENVNELTILLNNVKFTFFHYSYPVEYSTAFDSLIKMPDLKNLASMKAFALGRRAKWKDYVDLYFIFKRFSLKDIAEQSRDIYRGEFNEKLFREQLYYFEDIDYSETVEFMPGFETSVEVIRASLQDIATS